NLDCPGIPLPGGGLPPFSACLVPPPGDFDSATSFVDVNDSGTAVFPALVGGSTRIAVLTGSNQALDLQQIWPAVPLAPAPIATLLRPQIANDGTVVFRDDLQRIVAVELTAAPAFPVNVIGASPEFATVGQAPGV